jgi:hypothetical protein
MRYCYVCKTDKPLSDFSKDPTRTHKASGKCKECKAEYDKRRLAKRRETEPPKRIVGRPGRPDGPVNRKDRNLRKNYGITLEQYRELEELQDCRCKICGVEASEQNVLHVDHCHNSNEIRGLLCSTCNLGLGMFKDSTTLLSGAIGYLMASSLRTGDTLLIGNEDRGS